MLEKYIDRKSFAKVIELLTKENKELQQEIKELKQEIKELKQKIKDWRITAEMPSNSDLLNYHL